MEYLKVTNWDKWQTYRKDRGQPPWIKIHRRIMRNLEWISLSDAERGQLVAIWLLAADHDGVIPASSEMIEKICFMTSPPDLEKFQQLQFIESLDANLTPERRQHVTPKAKAKAEAEKNIPIFKFKNKRLLPETFHLTDHFKNYIIKNGCDDESHMDFLLMKFKNHAGSNGRKQQDWGLAFMNWVLQDKKKYNPEKYIIYEEMT